MSYTCKHGCGKTYDHRGAMNLHEKYHCSLLTESKVSRETKKECKHEFRFLNPGNQNEYLAIKEGYTQVCQICQIVQ